MTLADLGAEVITIEEARTGEGAHRLHVGMTDHTHRRYLTNNRNKKSVALNLKIKEGKEVFYRLAKKADIILEGFRPGVAKRLDVHYEKLIEINPSIIYCSLTGYGQDGPYANRPGHDINYIGIGGVLSLTGQHDGPPIVPGVPIADLGGGYSQATIAIMAALLARQNTGRGQFIDIAMLDGVVFWLWHDAIQYLVQGILPQRGGSTSSPAYAVYPTKDGQYITIGCVEPWLWENLCRAISCEDFLPYYYWQEIPKEKQDDIRVRLTEIFASKTRDEWVSLLENANVPCAPVNSFSEVFLDPQVVHRKLVVEMDHPTLGKIKQLACPIKMSDTPPEYRTPPPRYGEHTVEVLAALGYDRLQIKQLREKGAIEQH